LIRSNKVTAEILNKGLKSHIVKLRGWSGKRLANPVRSGRKQP